MTGNSLQPLPSCIAPQVPLEVTHTALATPDILARLCPESASPFLRTIRDLLLFFAATYKVRGL